MRSGQICIGLTILSVHSAVPASVMAESYDTVGGVELGGTNSFLERLARVSVGGKDHASVVVPPSRLRLGIVGALTAIASRRCSHAALLALL